MAQGYDKIVATSDCHGACRTVAGFRCGSEVRPGFGLVEKDLADVRDVLIAEAFVCRFLGAPHGCGLVFFRPTVAEADAFFFFVEKSFTQPKRTWTRMLDVDAVRIVRETQGVSSVRVADADVERAAYEHRTPCLCVCHAR